MKVVYHGKKYFITGKDYQRIASWLDDYCDDILSDKYKEIIHNNIIKDLNDYEKRNPDAERERWYDNLSWKQKLCTWDFWQWWIFIAAVAAAAYCLLPGLIMIIGVFVLFFGKMLFGRDIEKF